MRRFLLHLVRFCLLPAALLLAGEAVLLGSGELWPIGRVLAYQASRPDARYLRAVDQVFYAYKFRGIAAKRPSVLVAGSSRTMKFRAGMFGDRANAFYNAGGLLNSARDVRDLAAALPAVASPAVVVLGIDLWWFNEAVAPTYSLPAEVTKDVGLRIDDHIVALRWLTRHPWAIAREAASLSMKRSDAIGIEARERGGGFRRDGSYVVRVPIPTTADGWRFIDREEPPIIERVTRATANFPPADSMSPARLATLDEALARFESQHVLVVGYLPPFSSAVLAKLRSDDRHARLWADFECRLPALFRQHQFPLVDASDVTRFGMDDRAMTDGMHAEETFHVHVVKAMLDDDRVREALPGADASVARALTSPRTNYWQADLGS